MGQVEDREVAYSADFVYQNHGFSAGLFVVVRDGIIEEITSDPGDVPRCNWPGMAIMPGFVNAHSHVFQRVIRGRVQGVPVANPEADFWSWREGMYRAAGAMTPEALAVIARYTYIEMLLAGFTSVAEFHYLHHQVGGRPYGDRGALGRGVIEGAQAANIRLTLLPVAYGRGGPGRPLEEAQARFGHRDVADFFETVESYQAGASGSGSLPVGLGLAIHSVRAVESGWFGPIAAYAEARGWPLHAHGCEQPREIELCLEEHGVEPLALLDGEGVLSPRMTLVHGVHLAPGDIERLRSRGATVCACPTTERDLGDGILPATALGAAGVPLALGTDSHAQIDPFAEMQGLEGHSRLQSLRRCQLLEPATDNMEKREVGPALINAATRGGEAAMGMAIGALEPGCPADFIAVDLNHRRVLGVGQDQLPSAIAMGGQLGSIREVVVGGTRVVKGGHHPQLEEAARDFRALTRHIYGD